MNSDEIYELLEVVGSEDSKNVKIELLKEFMQDGDFERVLKYAYNPFKRFYMQRLKPLRAGASGEFSEQTWNVLDRLSSRDLSGYEAVGVCNDTMSALSEASESLFLRILKKDLRAGFSAKSINKAKRGTVPVAPYMRASLPNRGTLKDFDWSAGVYSQEKLDGSFASVIKDKKSVSVFTRTGKQYPHNLAEYLDIEMPQGQHIHGELLIGDGDEVLDRKTGNGILNSIMQGGDLDGDRTILFVAWYMVYSTTVEDNAPSEYYSERFARLGDETDCAVVASKLVYSMEEAMKHYDTVVANGGEGTILKTPTMLWKNHTSPHQVKLKQENEADLVVLGLNEGTGKNAETFGSLLCATADGDMEVSVSGFTDSQRVEISKSVDEWIGEIIAVRYNEKITDRNGNNSLFLPRFVERRTDKTVADTWDALA